MSCCNCNCSPCQCNTAVCCPDTDTIEYLFENQNTTGIGFWDNTTDSVVGFRGLVSDSVALTLTLDAPNTVIRIDFDGSLLVDDLPDATTTQRGVLETATTAEAQAKAATDKILTPSNLANIGATQTFAGLIEIATNAEAIAGASSTLSITPASLAAVVATIQGTTTFADAVARAAAVPDFDGQLGTQLNSNTPYVATAVAAGFWAPILAFGSTSQPDTAGTDVDFIGGADLNFNSSDTSGSVNFGNAAGGIVVTFASNTSVAFTSCDVNLSSITLAIGGVTVPAASVLVTAGAGAPSSRLLNTFISTANTQTGWGTPSGTLDRTTFATYTSAAISNPPTQAEVQAIADALQDVSRGLGALITDLKAVLLPAT